MTVNERFNCLKKRLHNLRTKNAISDNRYLAAETILQQAEKFMEMEVPPGVQVDSLIEGGLETAEKLIKVAEDKI